MATKKYFFELYKKCLDNGELPHNGLCNTIETEYAHLLDLFDPGRKDIGYWACGYDYTDSYDRAYKFTDLRQTIVLFCAAINNEL